jgi:hypothetical protein
LVGEGEGGGRAIWNEEETQTDKRLPIEHSGVDWKMFHEKKKGIGTTSAARRHRRHRKRSSEKKRRKKKRKKNLQEVVNLAAYTHAAILY